MEPNHETTPSAAELPMPIAIHSGEEQSLEQAPSSPEAQSTVAAPVMQAQQIQKADDGVPTSQQIGAMPSAAPVVDDQTMMADDADLIEKEWIVRAKAIVSQTTGDPHAQNKEINKMKAEYIKKRYNKDIRVDEG